MRQWFSFGWWKLAIFVVLIIITTWASIMAAAASLGTNGEPPLDYMILPYILAWPFLNYKIINNLLDNVDGAMVVAIMLNFIYLWLLSEALKRLLFRVIRKLSP